MKVARNDNNNPLSPAEMAACQQFEASAQAGQVLFHPRVTAGQPAPNCVALFDEVGRFGITILEGLYSVEGDRWFRHQADGAGSPVDDPLEGTWQAAKSVRGELKEGAGFQCLRHCRGLVPRHGRGRRHPGRGRWPQRAAVLRSD